MLDTVRQPVQDDRTQQARRMAAERFQGEPDWVKFYREVLGVDGVISKLFPLLDDRNQFEKTDEYAEIQQMLAKLRERNRIQKQPDEPTRVITVRLPQSLHEALRHEAHNFRTSMNKLCISKLLQVIADELVPSDFAAHEEEAELVEPARPPLPAPPPPAHSTFTATSFAIPTQPTTHHQAAQPTFGMRPMSPPPMPGGTTF